MKWNFLTNLCPFWCRYRHRSHHVECSRPFLCLSKSVSCISSLTLCVSDISPVLVRIIPHVYCCILYNSFISLALSTGHQNWLLQCKEQVYFGMWPRFLPRFWLEAGNGTTLKTKTWYPMCRAAPSQRHKACDWILHCEIGQSLKLELAQKRDSQSACVASCEAKKSGRTAQRGVLIYSWAKSTARASERNTGSLHGGVTTDTKFVKSRLAVFSRGELTVRMNLLGACIARDGPDSSYL